MRKLISYSYNTRARVASFLLDLRAINLVSLFSVVGFVSGVMIIEEGNLDNLRLCSLSKTADTGIPQMVFEVTKQDFETMTSVCNSTGAEISIISFVNKESQQRFLADPSYCIEHIDDSGLAKCVLDVDQFESEIRVLIFGINLIEFEDVKNKFAKC